MWEAFAAAFNAYSAKNKGGGAGAAGAPGFVLDAPFSEAPWIVSTGSSKLSAGNANADNALPLVIGAGLLGLFVLIGVAVWAVRK